MLSKGNELFRSVMNSSSHFLPTGLLVRLRVIGQAQSKRCRLFPQDVPPTPAPRGQKGEWWGRYCLEWIFHPKRGDGQNRIQRSFLGQACRRSQCPSVKQVLFQRERALSWEGSRKLRCCLEAWSPFGWSGQQVLPGHFSSCFSLLRPWGLWGL